MSTNDYHLVPAYGKTFANQAEVLQAWQDNIDFKAINEHGTYINKSTYDNYCNRLDGVFYCFDGLYVPLETGLL